MLVDLTQLRTFVAVAEEQQFTRAAERLHISLSAASTHVRAVEDSVGTPLFVRTKRNLELTRTGEILLYQARTLLHEAARFTSLARKCRGEVAGNLVIAASGESGSRLGQIAITLQASHPLIVLDLRARASVGAHQGLIAGELDACMLQARALDPSLTYYHLTAVPYRVAGPAAWKARIQDADLAQLARMPWLVPGERSSSHFVMLRELFGEMAFQLSAVLHYGHASLGRTALEAGLGMMLLREEYALEGERAGSLALSSVRTEIGQYVAHSASRGSDPLIRAFVEAAGDAWPTMKLAPPDALSNTPGVVD